jgi:hypothetical protein
VERKYSSYSFLTSALDGGEWSASRTGCALALGKGPPVPILQETGWAPEPEATGKILSPLPGIEPRSPGRLPRNIYETTLQISFTFVVEGLHKTPSQTNLHDARMQPHFDLKLLSTDICSYTSEVAVTIFLVF